MNIFMKNLLFFITLPLLIISDAKSLVYCEIKIDYVENASRRQFRTMARKKYDKVSQSQYFKGDPDKEIIRSKTSPKKCFKIVERVTKEKKLCSLNLGEDSYAKDILVFAKKSFRGRIEKKKFNCDND